MKDKKVSISTALTMAAAAGATALLLAPKKGKTLRKDMKQGAKELSWEAQALFRDFVREYKSNYQEIDYQSEYEKQHQLDRQKRLERTIADIEADLKINP